MPLTQTAEFKGVVQKGNRVQIPVLVRWKHKLDAGEVFEVRVSPVGSYADETFYAKMSTDGRITIPKLQAAILAEKIEEKTLEGYAVTVTLFPIGEEEE